MAKAPCGRPGLRTLNALCSLIGSPQAAGGMDSPLMGTRLVDHETFIGWHATPKHPCVVKVRRR